ncbi:hypothetical protein BGX28_002542 [Mortierella sp. GBA30]|nr:hypothetical protein BGX28_002542 [Mortierella sp. GBA30]
MALGTLAKKIKLGTLEGYRRLKRELAGISSDVKQTVENKTKEQKQEGTQISPTSSGTAPHTPWIKGKQAAQAWTNWAGNQGCNPAQIFNPETQQDLITIVQQAKAAGKKVRCAGSGHTWSSSSVTNEEGFLVIVNKMAKIYSPVLVQEGVDKGVWTVEVETGVLVKGLDDVLRQHNPPLALPSNVVLDSRLSSGPNEIKTNLELYPWQHGAATHTRTLPDLVTAVKIIDATGALRTFTKETDPAEFSAATINLGLLGIIYSYTTRVEPMFNLTLTDTFPPVSDLFSSPKLSGPILKAMVQGNDQTEIFYWPFNTSGSGSSNDVVWVKQWRRTELPLTESPDEEAFKKMLQNLQTQFGAPLFQFMALHPECTPFVDFLLFSSIKNPSQRVIQAPDGIHYQAGTDNVPCLDMEMAFKADENFENVVKAWTFVIDKTYEYASKDEFPFNLSMEMRFVKASDMIMSNAYDEDPEAIYCNIEILSVINTQGFDEFSAMVAKYWMDEFKARPHWAKMWEHIPGITPYLRQQAGARYDRFETIRKKYDPQGMFMNKTFAGLLGHLSP